MTRPEHLPLPERYGQIAEEEARSRCIFDEARIDTHPDFGVVYYHDRFKLWWRKTADMRATPQPTGWKGGVPPSHAEVWAGVD